MAKSELQAMRIRTVAVFATVGALLGAGTGYVIGVVDQGYVQGITILATLLGAVLAGGIGAFEEFLLVRVSRRLGHLTLNGLRFVVYLSGIVVVLIVGNGAYQAITKDLSYPGGIELYLSHEPWLRDVAVAVVGAIVVIVLMIVRRLHGAHEILSLFTGRYHYPEEETRTVLFADLVGSTTIAERLGPLVYSSFLRECFAELSEPVVAWKGELYQHLGDALIVTWRHKDAKPGRFRALRCLFEMQDVLAAHAGMYEARFGVRPRIRGSVHVGPVIMTWVGGAKRELALHGDVLNAAARMQALCRPLGATCIASAEYMSDHAAELPFDVRDLGHHELRGKANRVRLYSVDRA